MNILYGSNNKITNVTRPSRDLLTSINALTSIALQPVPNLIDSAVEMCTPGGVHAHVNIFLQSIVYKMAEAGCMNKYQVVKLVGQTDLANLKRGSRAPNMPTLFHSRVKPTKNRNIDK